MKRYTFENGLGITAPSGICFAFNPNKLKIEGGVRLSVVVSAEIRSDTVTYQDIREANNDVEIDISPYLQLLCEANGRRPIEATIGYTVSDSDGNDYTGSLEITVLWGAIGIGDMYAGATFRRWFKAYDDTNVNSYQIFIPSDTKEISVSENGGAPRTVSVTTTGLFELTPKFFNTSFPELRTATLTFIKDTSSTFDTTFDSTFFDLGGGNRTLRIVFDDRKCGKFLKWISRNGVTYQYLFETGDIKITTDDAGEDFNVAHGDYAFDYYGVTKHTRKRTMKQANICAPLISKEEMEYVSTIMDSQEIHEYDYANGVWTPLRVDPGEYIIMDWEKNPLQDFETQIMYPQIISQEL